MLKISLLFKKNTDFTVNNSKILRVKNAKFLWYCFYVNFNIWGDFQICISVPLKERLSQKGVFQTPNVFFTVSILQQFNQFLMFNCRKKPAALLKN